MEKKRKPFILWAIIIFGLILIVYHSSNYFVYKKITKWLEVPNSGFSVESYCHLKINIWKGTLKIEEVVFNWKVEKKTVTQFEIGRIDIKGIQVFELWKNKNIVIKQLEISDPTIIFSIASLEHNTEEKEKKETKSSPDLNIEHLIIKNGEIAKEDKTNKPITSLYINEAELNNIVINDWTNPSKIYEDLNDYHIEIKELRHQVTAWEIVTAKEIYLSNEEYYANQVDFYTELDIKEYNSRLLHERDHYTIKIPKITLAVPEWKTRGTKQGFMLEFVNIHSPSVNIYRDKLLPDDTSYKPMFSQLLRDLKFDIHAQEIKLYEADIKYTERVKEENEGGTVHFNMFNANLQNVSNFIEINKEFPVEIHVESKFMETANLIADWSFNPQTVDDNFTFEAKISHLDASRANEFTEPNLLVKMEGELDQVYINLYGDRYRSTTDFAISFHELKVALLRKDGKEKRKLISAIANIFVRKESNKENKTMREARVSVERDTTKSVFNFLWKNTLEGLKETMINKP